jgi:hypothetical protein
MRQKAIQEKELRKREEQAMVKKYEQEKQIRKTQEAREMAIAYKASEDSKLLKH